MYNWYYSLWATTSFYNIDYYSLVKRLHFLNCSKIVIYDIIPFNKESTVDVLNNDFRNYLPVSIDNPYYIKYTLGLREFFKSENIELLTNNNMEYFENDTIINHSIFIFNSMPLPFIIAAFKLQNILLTSGSKNKRGVLSPIQLRLAQFNTCLEGIKKNTITESFYNYNSLAIQPIFNHFTMDKIRGFRDITNFFNILEDYFKFKVNNNNNNNININNNINNNNNIYNNSDLDFNIRKNLNTKENIIDFNEFLEYYKSKKLNFKN